uniref:Replication protein A C-terminal domain-containing protein n=1 Tax=Mola mola TaxID=94237 RepID=A0A3Q3X1I6_MOLML
MSAPQVSNDTFAVCDLELNQVSIVGIVRGFTPFVTNMQYSVDDMTGPPLCVKQWLNEEDWSLTSVPPGTYVKVIGSLRNFSGQRSVLAMNIRCIKDLNEITSHMLEVVQAHMLLFEKVLKGLRESSLKVKPKHPDRPQVVLSSIAHKPSRYGVWGLVYKNTNLLRSCVLAEGISLQDLKSQLDYLSMRDIRASLVFLVNEGHIFSTIDEHHFKSAEH